MRCPTLLCIDFCDRFWPTTTSNFFFRIRQVLILHDKELATVGIWTSVSHGQGTTDIVKFFWEFILKWFAVDWLATHTSSSWVSTLNHKVLDNTVENDTIIVAIFWKSYKVSHCFRSMFREELDTQVSVIGLNSRQRTFYCFNIYLWEMQFFFYHTKSF